MSWNHFLLVLLSARAASLSLILVAALKGDTVLEELTGIGQGLSSSPKF
jgi:hypothetical protein